MTVLAPSFPTFGRKHPPDTTSRFGRNVRRNRARPESWTPKMQEIRERLDREAYDVDAHKIADAILERLLAGRAVRDALNH